jgi:hypothetical protein
LTNSHSLFDSGKTAGAAATTSTAKPAEKETLAAPTPHKKDASKDGSHTSSEKKPKKRFSLFSKN